MAIIYDAEVQSGSQWLIVAQSGSKWFKKVQKSSKYYRLLLSIHMPLVVSVRKPTVTEPA